MKNRPVGICNTCGNYAYKTDEIGQSCHAHHHGETCTGDMQDASGAADWQSCPACSDKGVEHAVDCPQCAGAGWLIA